MRLKEIQTPVLKLSEELIQCRKKNVANLKLATLFEPTKFKKFNKEVILREI
jgi:hypothetical protein